MNSLDVKVNKLIFPTISSLLKNEYFNNWIEQKIDDTLITIVDDFRSCPNLMRYYEEDNNVLNR